ncbi:hypothetical protein K1T71_003925 [Dendrolimus kikuchii]|uniref:Uncharacterized protein n=1 Tax=Dendrolimus kikuchii TaxID=765133 RepID=A0ACC1D9F6_9NEOP|nr:hypothetical protein K1T71_003925 [Dendrolimus kikuchii]
MSLKIEADISVGSEPCVGAWSEKIFIGTEDGFIRSYNTDLSSATSWAAHAVQPFAIAAGGGTVYSSSNDGGIRVWTPEGTKLKELPITGGDIGSIYVFDKHVYAGDEVGNVLVYENNEIKATYQVLEEVKDLCFNEPFLFTVRDLYVTVTEIKPEESKTRFLTRHAMEGRAPIRISGQFLLFMSRDGNHLRLHEASINTNFKFLHEVKVSDMIVTSIAVIGDYAFTGGWDGFVRRWKICNNQLEPSGVLEVGSCVNALISGSNSVYAALSGGRLIRIKS